VVLAGLGALPDLQELDLSGTAVTAIGLASCASRHYADTGRPIPPLRRLHLGRCKGIAGRALEIIAGFAQLEELDLTRSGLVSRGVVAAAEREGAADFVALGRLQRLRSLSLSGVRLAPGDCRAIAGLPQLETLDLSFAGDGIDDTALGHLGNMRGLRDLRLAGCDAFTDDGLARLGGMRQLRRLDLNVCAGFTAAGVKGLREALADLEVALPQRLR
jgi:hypothetical protein